MCLNRCREPREIRDHEAPCWRRSHRPGGSTNTRLAFEKMLTYANHVGLLAEEIGPTGEQLGNLPEAFTHLALIKAGLQPRPAALG